MSIRRCFDAGTAALRDSAPTVAESAEDNIRGYAVLASNANSHRQRAQQRIPKRCRRPKPVDGAARRRSVEHVGDNTKRPCLTRQCVKYVHGKVWHGESVPIHAISSSSSSSSCSSRTHPVRWDNKTVEVVTDDLFNDYSAAARRAKSSRLVFRIVCEPCELPFGPRRRTKFNV